MRSYSLWDRRPCQWVQTTPQRLMKLHELRLHVKKMHTTRSVLDTTFLAAHLEEICRIPRSQGGAELSHTSDLGVCRVADRRTFFSACRWSRWRRLARPGTPTFQLNRGGPVLRATVPACSRCSASCPARCASRAPGCSRGPVSALLMRRPGHPKSKCRR